ncbi:MAG: IS5/IS1182 family transposase, partial [Burkholderiales bacterium]|nr:IS5/IS1182 family transposase [Burkholderiales bacterium]
RDFRALHLKELAELFVQVVKLAQEMGLVKLGTVSANNPTNSRRSTTHSGRP